jgi:hypothetical protein
MQTAFAGRGAPALVELYREEGHHCYGRGNAVVVYSVAEPDSAYMERNAIAMRLYASAHPTGLGAMVLIPDIAKPPSEAARHALRAGYTAMKSFMRGAVLILEGEGFAAAAKRSAFTILNLAAPLPFPVKVAGTPLEAADKLVALLGPALEPQLDSQLLAAMVEEVRAAR